MSEQPERLDLRSDDTAGDTLAQLLELFPDARTEDGQIDFDQLRGALGREANAVQIFNAADVTFRTV